MTLLIEVPRLFCKPRIVRARVGRKLNVIGTLTEVSTVVYMLTSKVTKMVEHPALARKHPQSFALQRKLTAIAPQAIGRRHVHLDRDIILETSREIFHQEGLGALTLRRLGSELGVDATAMYRHFRNKGSLLTALINELFVEIPEPDPSRSWRDNLRDLMAAWWLIYRQNEGLAQAMAGQPDDEPRLFHLTEWTIRELIRAGIPRDEIGLFHQTIYNHTVGNGLVAAFSPWLTTQKLRDEQRRIYAALNPEEFPSAAAAAPTIYPETEKAFMFSVELLLDGIESRARANMPS